MDRNLNCLIQSSTRDFVYETLHASLPITAPRCRFPSNVTFTLLPMKTSTALLQCYFFTIKYDLDGLGK